MDWVEAGEARVRAGAWRCSCAGFSHGRPLVSELSLVPVGGFYLPSLPPERTRGITRSPFISCGLTSNVDLPLLNYFPEPGGSWFRVSVATDTLRAALKKQLQTFTQFITNVTLSGAEKPTACRWHGTIMPWS